MEHDALLGVDELAPIDPGIGFAYDRAKRLQLRRDLVTWYESTLLAARDGARVVAIPRLQAK